MMDTVIIKGKQWYQVIHDCFPTVNRWIDSIFEPSQEQTSPKTLHFLSNDQMKGFLKTRLHSYCKYCNHREVHINILESETVIQCKVCYKGYRFQNNDEDDTLQCFEEGVIFWNELNMK